MKKIKIILYFTIAIQLFGIFSCKISHGDFSPPGDDNIIIYAPNNSKTYNVTEINEYINYHQVTINFIDERISYYKIIKSKNDENLKKGTIKPRAHEKKKRETENKIKELERKKSKAEDVLELWKGLLVSDEKEDNKSEDPAPKSTSTNSQMTKPNNCHIVSLANNNVLNFRSKPLTREEINALNSCDSKIRNGITYYEAPNRADCQIKRRLDMESSIGYVSRGDMVDLIGKTGSWYEIIDINTGRKGFIACKLGGIDTLEKINCN